MSSKHIYCHPTSGFRCDDVHPGSDVSGPSNVDLEAAGDPATLIGLALAFARQGALFNGEVPPLILKRLALHVELGNPACRMVLDWLERGRRMEQVTIPETQVSRRRRSAHDRVMQALASVPEPDPEERPLRRSRIRRERFPEIISATARKAAGKTSHG
ncbi:hypothetical protein ACU5AY_11140 [Rhizobium sp. PAMB 3174]